MNRILLLMAIVFLGIQMATAAIIQVPGDYTTIAAAIANAADGDIINIAAGTYTEYSLYSAADKSVTVRGVSRDATIIQAKSTPYSVSGNRAVFAIGAITLDRTINIQNLTIQNGFYGSSSGGGGIRVTPGATNKLTLNVTNVNLFNNCSVGNMNVYGGGITLAGNIDATLTNCTLTGNKNTGTAAGAGGGAIYVASSAVSLLIDGCNISGNTGGAKGGGAILSGVVGGTATGPLNIKIKNSTLSSNTVTGPEDNTAFGGAIKILCGANTETPMSHSLWIENSTIYNNSTQVANRNGGGIYFQSAASGQAVNPTQTITINHCTIVNNTTVSGTGGDGVCISSDGGYPITLVMNNSIVMNNTGSTVNPSQIGESSATSEKIINGGITNSIFNIIEGGSWVTSANNNNLTALVSELKFAESLSADVTPILKMDSASIARNYVANNYLVPALTTDQLGNPRVENTDAGAWENQGHVVLSQRNPSSDIATFKVSAINNGVKISNIFEKSTIRVFDMMGKMAANKIADGNAIEIHLNTKGIYIVLVDDGISTKSMKVIY